jgi:hypothetical protein
VWRGDGLLAEDHSLIEFVSNYAGMFAIFLASILGGFVLGLRFRVMVLIPTIIICILGIVAGGVTFRAGTWPIVIAAAINAAGLQVGYLFGIWAAFTLRSHPGNLADRLLGRTAFSLPERTAPSRRATGVPPPSDQT